MFRLITAVCFSIATNVSGIKTSECKEHRDQADQAGILAKEDDFHALIILLNTFYRKLEDEKNYDDFFASILKWFVDTKKQYGAEGLRAAVNSYRYCDTALTTFMYHLDEHFSTSEGTNQWEKIEKILQMFIDAGADVLLRRHDIDGTRHGSNNALEMAAERICWHRKYAQIWPALAYGREKMRTVERFQRVFDMLLPVAFRQAVGFYGNQQIIRYFCTLNMPAEIIKNIVPSLEFNFKHFVDKTDAPLIFKRFALYPGFIAKIELTHGDFERLEPRQATGKNDYPIALAQSVADHAEFSDGDSKFLAGSPAASQKEKSSLLTKPFVPFGSLNLSLGLTSMFLFLLILFGQ